MTTQEKVAAIDANVDNVYKAGYEKGKAEGAEVFFTNHGTMYKRNMVIETDHYDGLYSYAYRYADKMETLDIPYLQSISTATLGVFQGCTSLVGANLPNMIKIGNNYFGDCTALKTVVLGSNDYPFVSISASAFSNCPSLENVSITGESGAITQSYSTSVHLTSESAENILVTLTNLIGTGKEFTLSVKLPSVVWQRVNAEKIPPTGDTWQAYANSKGWNV